jgi:hypothetical protein
MSDSLSEAVDERLQLDGKTDAATRKEAVSLLKERLDGDRYADDDGVVIDHALEDAGVHREVRLAVVDQLATALGSQSTGGIPA